jgi:hypothetical protein
MDICVDDYRVGGVMMFDAHTGQGLVGECLFIVIVFLFFSRGLCLRQDCGVGSDAGQLVVVPAPVAVALAVEAGGTKGALQDPWSKFCASGKIVRPPPLKTWQVLFPSS